MHARVHTLRPRPIDDNRVAARVRVERRRLRHADAARGAGVARAVAEAVGVACGAVVHEGVRGEHVAHEGPGVGEVRAGEKLHLEGAVRGDVFVLDEYRALRQNEII